MRAGVGKKKCMRQGKGHIMWKILGMRKAKEIRPGGGADYSREGRSCEEEEQGTRRMREYGQVNGHERVALVGRDERVKLW